MKVEIEYIVSFSQKNKIPLTIVGNGSNVLVSDSGIRGITLKIGLKEINVTKKEELAIVEVDSGVMLGTLAQILLKQGVAGFEFAAGIPGSIGGAIRMNAGAYGGEFKDIVEEVTILNEKGQSSIDAYENYDKRRVVKNIQATVLDAFGNEIKKIKRKD